MKSIIFQALKGKWFMFFASSLIMSVSGASYMFSLYSRDIKFVLGYDQSTLNLLSFFKDLGSNVGIISGLINEVTPPWVVLTLGGLLNFFGYFMVWLAVTNKIPKPQVWNMCLYIFIGANSHCSTNTGVVVTSVKNIPGNRGVVIGFLSGYLGLSAAIITQIYLSFYGNDSKSLLLLMAWLPTVTIFFFLPVIRILKAAPKHPNEYKTLYKFVYISLALAAFLMIMIILQQTLTFTQDEYYSSMAGMLFLLLLVPLSHVILEEHKLFKSNTQDLNSRDLLPSLQDSSASLPKPAEQSSFSCWDGKSIFSRPQRGEDYTILQAIFSVDMLILFLSTMCGVGGNLTVVNNLTQIGTSLGYPFHSILTFVSLISIWIYLGKIVVGVVSELIITKLKFPRPLMVTTILVLSSVGHLLIAFNVPNGLYVASIIIGFCFGANWPLLFTIISELFGLKYYSTLYNVGSIASPLGSYLLGVKVAGYLYDKEAKKQMVEMGIKRKPGEQLNCNGGECFRLAFIIIAAITLFGALVSLILVFRTRKFYGGDIYKKFRDEARVAEGEMVVAENRVGSTELTNGV